jgi:Uma2 family endonuclease
MTLPVLQFSLDDFLVWENFQPARHEFCRGKVTAMEDARRVHSLVGGNVYAALRLHLKGTRCRAFVEGTKVQLANDAVFYPDVFVTCDKADLKTEMVFRHPTLVVEVLSPSTQAFDRGLKFSAYRQLTSLREYLLVDPDTRSVEVFRRNERDNFELIDQTGHAEMVLDSVGLHLAMPEVFDGVDAAPPDAS